MIKNIITVMFSILFLLPVWSCDKPIKFKLNDVKENSLYDMIGFKSGDIIVKIDGQEICNLSNVQDKFSNLKNTSKISFKILRNNKSKKIEFVMKD
jgi:type II secretory pathway component PulC